MLLALVWVRLGGVHPPRLCDSVRIRSAPCGSSATPELSAFVVWQRSERRRAAILCVGFLSRDPVLNNLLPASWRSEQGPTFVKYENTLLEAAEAGMRVYCDLCDTEA